MNSSKIELSFVDVLVLVQGTAVTTAIYYKQWTPICRRTGISTRDYSYNSYILQNNGLPFVDVLVLVQGTAVTTDIYYKTMDSHL